jgi:hypothetical protein
MKARYRLFPRRKSVYYAFDKLTRKFQSLDTRKRDEAVRLVRSLNEAARQPAMNLRLARVYLQHSDPAFSSRTWQHVMLDVPVGTVKSRIAEGIAELREIMFSDESHASTPFNANTQDGALVPVPGWNQAAWLVSHLCHGRV